MREANTMVKWAPRTIKEQRGLQALKRMLELRLLG